MLSVQTNTTALSVQRFLNKSAQAQSSNQGKASSGSNIVRAADDAAGLAISNKMRADIASLRQGQKNASQGASLLQIANGATDRAVDILTRLKELASNNDLLGAAEKQFKQAEVNQLLDQLNAIATQTTVTGRAIMNGVDKTTIGAQTTTVSGLTGGTSDFNIATNGISDAFGTVNGQVSDARVMEVGATYVAEIDLGGRTFRSTPISNTAAKNTTLTFVDTKDPQSRFNALLGGSSGNFVTNNASLYQNNLRQSLNVYAMSSATFTQSTTSTTSIAGTLGTAGTTALAADYKFKTVANTALTIPAVNSADFAALGVREAIGVSGQLASANISVTAANSLINVSIAVGGKTLTGSIADNAAAATRTTGIVLTSADGSARLRLELTGTGNSANATLAPGSVGAYQTQLRASLDNVVLSQDIRGGTSGVYKGATVTEIAGQYRIDVAIGNQVYRAQVGNTAAVGQTIQFKSLTNDNNKFSLYLGGATAFTGGNATNIQNALDATFNLTPSPTASTVSFKAGQAADIVAAGVLKSGATSLSDVVRTSSATKAGVYTLTSNYVAGNPITNIAEKVVFRLEDSDGNISEAEVKSDYGTVTDGVLIDPASTKGRVISFANGITINTDAVSLNALTNNDNAIGSRDAKAIRFTVGDGESTILKFQTGIASTDVLSVGLDAVNVKSLGLTGISMEDTAKAADAVDRVDAALARVNVLSANIGAQQSRLDFTMDVNAITLENYQAANSVVRDADLSAVLTDLSQATLRNNVATAILSQANQTPTQTVSRLLQGL